MRMSWLKSTRWESWIQFLLLTLIAVSVLWRGGKSLDATWILAGMTFFIVIFSHFSSLRKKPVPWILWLPAVLLMFWTIASYLLSSTANYGFDELLRAISLGLLFLWSARYIQQEEGRLQANRLVRCLRWISIITLIACVIGYVVYIFQPVNRFVGTFFDPRFHTDYWPNAWAAYLLLTWPVVYYWAFSRWMPERTRARRAFSFALRAAVVAFILSALFLSYSRGGIIAFSGQIILWAGFSYAHVKDYRIWLRIAVGAISILALSILLFQAGNMLRSDVHEVQSVTQKVTFTADEGVSSVSERSSFWQQAFSLSLEKPFFGWGPYSFRFIQPHVQTDILATSDHPHNVLLKYAMETGWPTVILFLFLVIIIFLRTLEVELRSAAGPVPLGTMLLISLAGLLSHSLIDYNLQFVGIALFFWLFLGWLAGHTVKTGDRMISPGLARSMEILLAICLLIAALIEGMYLVTSSIGRHAEANGREQQAILWYERSENAFFSRDLYLSQAVIFLKNNRLTTAERSLWNYFDENEQDARAWKLQGQIHAENFKTQKAVAAYEVAYDYGKYNDVGVMLGLIQAYLDNDQRGAVNARKNEFDNLIKLYGNAILLNTHFIVLSPNVEQFIELCELMAEMYPDDAPLYIVMAAKADDHAQIERSRITARPPGFLW